METVQQALTAMRDNATSLEDLYGLARRLHARGALSNSVRTEVHAKAQANYLIEVQLYGAIVRILQSVPYAGTPASWLVPSPTEPEVLPVAQIVNGVVMSGPPSPLVPAASALPLLIPIWAILVLALLVTLGVSGTVLGVALISADLVRDIVALKEDTRRYLAALVGRVDVFERCMVSNGTVLVCAVTARLVVPRAPSAIDPIDSGRWSWYQYVLVAGGLSGVGYLFWRYGDFSKPQHKRVK